MCQSPTNNIGGPVQGAGEAKKENQSWVKWLQRPVLCSQLVSLSPWGTECEYSGWKVPDGVQKLPAWPQFCWVDLGIPFLGLPSYPPSASPKESFYPLFLCDWDKYGIIQNLHFAHEENALFSSKPSFNIFVTQNFRLVHVIHILSARPKKFTHTPRAYSYPSS